MQTKTYNSQSFEQTFSIAESLGKSAQKGEIYCLRGELGAGKTVFAKGFAKGLGITEDVTSPTFAIVNEYIGKLPFFHFDVYRIQHIDEMADTGYEEYFYSNGVCLVEWADLIQPLIPAQATWITITKISENLRRIDIYENSGD